MILSKHLIHLFFLIVIQYSLSSSTVVKRDNYVSVPNINHSNGLVPERNLFGEEKSLEQEILKELNHLSPRKQKEIFDDLEKQREKFNATRKSLVFSETENLSPISLEELKSVRKTIQAPNSTFPAIRNKRTLNFLLLAVARAMGYTLAPTNPNAEWIPRQHPPSAQPCATPPPPCSSNPPSTPSSCTMPPTTPPCPGSNALMQPATIPPNQIDANTISYPYRPARTIPLFNFAPLPAGIRVLYPPLLQPPAQQGSPCTTQQPLPPCSMTPSPSSPSCGTTPPSRTPPPCRPTPTPPPHPCGPTPPPSPAPCGTTPASSPSPCKPNPSPPCSTTPAPSSPPCMTTPAPCATTPVPCATTPAPCATTPAPSQPPCGTPQTPKPPPCTTPAPPSCGNSQPSPTPPLSEPPKRGSILLEYDDPVRIQIFSNDKKYLPVSGNVYSGHDDNHKEDWHSHFFPDTEKNRKKDEDLEEMEEEHIEQEEEEEEENEKAPGQLKHYEEEDERTLANKEEEEEDESETSLSIVKKPVDQDIQKTHRRRLVTTKTQTSVLGNKDQKNEKEDSKYEKSEKPQKMKKPKRKKWVRIVKKQRKTKTDLNPQNHYETYASDTFPEASRTAPKYYGKGGSQFAFDSYEKDISDFSDDSSSRSSEDVSKIDLKKVIINNKEINSPELLRDDRRYEFNFNPYVLEPEEQRRKKLEKAVERYVEEYVEKQLGDELIKNTGVPKTTVFEFASKNGPKIQTITTTVAKTSHNKNLSNFKPQIRPETRPLYKNSTGNAYALKGNNYGKNFKRRGNFDYDTFATRKQFF